MIGKKPPVQECFAGLACAIISGKSPVPDFFAKLGNQRREQFLVALLAQIFIGRKPSDCRIKNIVWRIWKIWM
jgi:hypothetical protein